jgi:hypothetical protein
VLFQFALKFLKQRKGIGRRPGKAGEYLIMIETPELLGIVLHHRGANRDLAITAHGNSFGAADA